MAKHKKKAASKKPIPAELIQFIKADAEYPLDLYYLGLSLSALLPTLLIIFLKDAIRIDASCQDQDDIYKFLVGMLMLVIVPCLVKDKLVYFTNHSFLQKHQQSIDTLNDRNLNLRAKSTSAIAALYPLVGPSLLSEALLYTFYGDNFFMRLIELSTITTPSIYFHLEAQYPERLDKSSEYLISLLGEPLSSKQIGHASLLKYFIKREYGNRAKNILPTLEACLPAEIKVNCHFFYYDNFLYVTIAHPFVLNDSINLVQIKEVISQSLLRTNPEREQRNNLLKFNNKISKTNEIKIQTNHDAPLLQTQNSNKFHKNSDKTDGRLNNKQSAPKILQKTFEDATTLIDMKMKTATNKLATYTCDKKTKSASDNQEKSSSNEQTTPANDKKTTTASNKKTSTASDKKTTFAGNTRTTPASNTKTTSASNKQTTAATNKQASKENLTSTIVKPLRHQADNSTIVKKGKTKIPSKKRTKNKTRTSSDAKKDQPSNVLLKIQIRKQDAPTPSTQKDGKERKQANDEQATTNDKTKTSNAPMPITAQDFRNNDSKLKSSKYVQLHLFSNDTKRKPNPKFVTPTKNQTNKSTKLKTPKTRKFKSRLSPKALPFIDTRSGPLIHTYDNNTSALFALEQLLGEKILGQKSGDFKFSSFLNTTELNCLEQTLNKLKLFNDQSDDNIIFTIYGGFLRDSLNQQKFSDIDIITNINPERFLPKKQFNNHSRHANDNKKRATLQTRFRIGSQNIDLRFVDFKANDLLSVALTLNYTMNVTFLSIHSNNGTNEIRLHQPVSNSIKHIKSKTLALVTKRNDAKSTRRRAFKEPYLLFYAICKNYRYDYNYSQELQSLIATADDFFKEYCQSQPKQIKVYYLFEALRNTFRKIGSPQFKAFYDSGMLHHVLGNLIYDNIKLRASFAIIRKEKLEIFCRQAFFNLNKFILQQEPNAPSNIYFAWIFFQLLVNDLASLSPNLPDILLKQKYSNSHFINGTHTINDINPNDRNNPNTELLKDFINNAVRLGSLQFPQFTWHPQNCLEILITLRNGIDLELNPDKIKQKTSNRHLAKPK